MASADAAPRTTTVVQIRRIRITIELVRVQTDAAVRHFLSADTKWSSAGNHVYWV